MTFSRSWRRWAVASIAAASAFMGGAAFGQAAYTPSEDDLVLLQLQVKNMRMAGELRGYQTPAGVCVDLADVVQSLDMPIRIDRKSRRATGWVFREVQTFAVERDSNTVQIVNNTRQLQPGELYDTPEGWCVDTKALGGWFGVSLTPNVRASTLTLDSETPLPFIEALERESRAARLRSDRDRDLSSYPQARQPYALWRLPAVDVVARAGFSSARGHTRLQPQFEIFASGEVARVSYDMRLASNAQGEPDSLRVRAYRMDPEGKLLGPLRATQAAVGDVEVLPGNLAGAGSVGRGAFVSNRPLQRSTRFGTTILRGALPLGWDAELYRNGQLLAFQGDERDGRYEFEVQLLFGQNDLEVVLYGPQGQIRRESQSVPVGYGAVAPGKLEYWAGVVERNRDLIEFGRPPPTGPPDGGWHYAAGLQYGLDRKTVVGAGGHSLVLYGRRRDYAELNLQRALGRLVLSLTGAQQFGAGRAYRLDMLGKVGPINVQTESYYVDGDFVSATISERDRQSHRIQLDTLLRLGRIPVPLAAGFRRTEARSGETVNEWLARGSLILPRMALTGYVVDRRTEGAYGPQDGTTLGGLVNTRIAGVTVRGEGRYRLNGPQAGFESASLTLEKALSERSDLRFDIEHAGRNGVTDFELGYVHQFRRVAVRGSGKVDTRGTLGANLAVSFSLGRDPLGGGWRMSSEKLAERGQAAVAVFLDENGDGIRSADEKPLAGVGITAGSYGSAEPTDRAGHAFVENLTPYDRVLVSIDESTLPDPFLVARGKGLVVTPRPGVPAVLELAVTPTGEVEGTLQATDGRAMAGVELELVASDGQVAARVRSEYDGFFLFDRVPYGRYALQVSADSARALGVSAELGQQVELSPQATLERVGTLRLRLPSELASAAASP